MNRRSFLKSAAMERARPGLGRAWHSAQDYPSRLIRIVASNSAGTPPDILARIAATALTDGEGWKVIVENKAGGVGTIAANEVLRQEPDGHTLFVGQDPAHGGSCLAAECVVQSGNGLCAGRPFWRPATTCWWSIRSCRFTRCPS